MNDKFEEFIADFFEINENINYEFHNLYGLIFVFKRTVFEFRKEIASTEISPVGIIYEENDEIYFAPLDEVTKIDAIVKEFVKNLLQNKNWFYPLKPPSKTSLKTYLLKGLQTTWIAKTDDISSHNSKNKESYTPLMMIYCQKKCN